MTLPCGVFSDRLKTVYCKTYKGGLALANLVLMPQMGISEESAILSEWRIKKGDKVNAGDVIFSIETGKSVFEIESEFSGVVLEILAETGDEILIKVPVCVIGCAGEVYTVEKSVGADTKSEAAPVVVNAEVKSFSPTTQVRTDSDKVCISPRARNLATKADVDVTLAKASGPEGRIIERDIRAVIESGVTHREELKYVPEAENFVIPQNGVSYTEKPLTNLRKIIAKNMASSLLNTAQLTHTASFDASVIQAYRKSLKEDAHLSGITLTDMVLYAVTRTLPDFPALNAWLVEDTMRYFTDVNLACAVDTERGLMVPVMFGASSKSLLQISKELKSLAESCRSGSVPLELLGGGSFTVSNLGAYGIESFTPILNAPQTGILGVNTITQRVKEVDGQIKMYPSMALSLTYDHRAIDGAPASKFLQQLCRNLENFTTLLAR